jgi:hypothetical protein
MMELFERKLIIEKKIMSVDPHPLPHSSCVETENGHHREAHPNRYRPDQS